MDLAPRFNLIDWLLFIVVLAVAGGLRGGYIALTLDRGSGPTPLLAQGDPDRDNARRLAEETTAPTGFQGAVRMAGDEPSPLFYRLLGLTRDRGMPGDALIRWIQLGLGTLTAGLYFLFTRRGFGSRVVGLVAGLLCALYPLWIINTAEINDGVACCFLVALALWLTARGGRTGGVVVSLLAGASLAALPLLRWTMIPFVVVCLAWYLGRCCMIRRGWLWILAVLVGFGGVLGGGFAADRSIADSWLSTAALQLWAGNNPAATGTPAGAGDPAEADADLAQLPSHQRDLRLLRSAWNWVRDNPFDATQARGKAATAFLFGGQTFTKRLVIESDVKEDRIPVAGEVIDKDPLPKKEAEKLEEQPQVEMPQPDMSSAWAGAGRTARSLAVPLLLMFLVLYLLVGLGWRWAYGWRRMSRPAILALLIALPYLLGQAGTLHGPRLPLDGVLLSLAAFALVCFIPVVRRRLVAGEFI